MGHYLLDTQYLDSAGEDVWIGGVLQPLDSSKMMFKLLHTVDEFAFLSPPSSKHRDIFFSANKSSRLFFV